MMKNDTNQHHTLFSLFSRFVIKLLLVTLLSLVTLSCTTFHRLDGIKDYSELKLQQGDRVIITTKDNEKLKMSIKSSDEKYFYGEDNVKKVRKDNIRSLELSRFYPGKIVFPLIGLLLLSFFFSG